MTHTHDFLIVEFSVSKPIGEPELRRLRFKAIEKTHCKPKVKIFWRGQPLHNGRKHNIARRHTIHINSYTSKFRFEQTLISALKEKYPAMLRETLRYRFEKGNVINFVIP